MTARMVACKPVTGGVDEAIWARDLLLIRLITSNPLRAKNLKLLTYKPDNTGNLYKKDDGSWNIWIDKKAFKNVKGAAGDQDYDIPVTANVWPIIEEYINVYRPMLPDADKVSFVFLSSVICQGRCHGLQTAVSVSFGLSGAGLSQTTPGLDQSLVGPRQRSGRAALAC